MTAPGRLLPVAKGYNRPKADLQELLFLADFCLSRGEENDPGCVKTR